jgi:carboxylate-amine ligase
VTSAHTDLAELGRELTDMRWATAAAARTIGVHVIPVAATPVGEHAAGLPERPLNGGAARRTGTAAGGNSEGCGSRIQVGVPDRRLAVRVTSGLRPWAAAVQALTANSPIHAGVDTGHASWRCIHLETWPRVEPIAEVRCADDYDRVVGALVDAGIGLDPTMAYWYVRPSAAEPSLEVRVGDVCPTVADTVLVAAIVRALVETDAGRRGPGCRQCRCRTVCCPRRTGAPPMTASTTGS